ncbi:MAG: hypothetical protein AB9834_13690 [Lentimicrobium sp.]
MVESFFNCQVKPGRLNPAFGEILTASPDAFFCNISVKTYQVWQTLIAFAKPGRLVPAVGEYKPAAPDASSCYISVKTCRVRPTLFAWVTASQFCG